MSEHAMTVQAPAGPSFYEKNYFLLRRLHSLTGIVPVGVFLMEHLFTSSSILLGSADYQKDINFIWNLPGLVLMEIFGIWLPIAFHAVLGLVYTFSGPPRPNAATYPYVRNWNYLLQRITGIIAMVYIFCHIATTRWHLQIGPWYTPFDPSYATITTVDAVQSSVWLPWFFLIGMLSAVFHLANGLWTAAITWGLTVSAAAQRRWGYVCIGIFVVTLACGATALGWAIAGHFAPASSAQAICNFPAPC